MSLASALYHTSALYKSKTLPVGITLFTADKDAKEADDVHRPGTSLVQVVEDCTKLVEQVQQRVGACTGEEDDEDAKCALQRLQMAMTALLQFFSSRHATTTTRG